MAEQIESSVEQSLARFQVTPIQTAYGGIRYRSRLEARWAVFFDSLGIPFEYEKEGYDLGDGIAYLPDFWLPSQKLWVEIKGDDPTYDENEKAHRLAVGTGHRVAVFYGGIVLPRMYHPETTPANMFFPDGSADREYLWCECDVCGAIGIEYEGRSNRLPCKECYLCAYYRKAPSQLRGLSDDDEQRRVWTTGVYLHREVCKTIGGCARMTDHLDKGYNAASSRLFAAYQAARAMRFGR